LWSLFISHFFFFLFFFGQFYLFITSSRWWFKFLFFFLQEFCFKNTLFDDGTENDFFFSVKCLYEFSVDFFLFVFFFSKQKSDFFSYVIESSDLCAVV